MYTKASESSRDGLCIASANVNYSSHIVGGNHCVKKTLAMQAKASPTHAKCTEDQAESRETLISMLKTMHINHQYDQNAFVDQVVVLLDRLFQWMLLDYY